MKPIQFSIKDFQQKLIAWYHANQRQLPWRETNDPYYIWVSEAMLQQTQVKKVLDYYSRFIERFPDLHRLADARIDDVLKIWEGLGYYARARNLHHAAQLVMTEMNGRIPDEYDEFIRLPGVGNYIAAAVMSIAFDRPYAVVDGNVKRVLARIFTIDRPLTDAAATKFVQDYADNLLDKGRAGQCNQAIMELGALVCTPQHPACALCPVAEYCQARAQQQQHLYPVRIKKKRTPEYRVGVGVIYRDEHLLIVRRPVNGLLGGLWEFPGGKIRSQNDISVSLIEKIHERTSLTVEIIDYLTVVKHAYSHFKIEIHVYKCNYLSGSVNLSRHQDYIWILPTELSRYPFHIANHKFLNLL